MGVGAQIENGACSSFQGELRWVYECSLASQAVEQALVNEILYGASYGDPAYFVLLAKLGFGGNLTAAGSSPETIFLRMSFSTV